MGVDSREEDFDAWKHGVKGELAHSPSVADRCRLVRAEENLRAPGRYSSEHLLM